MNFQPFTDEQARVIVNLEQAYQVWMEALRTLNDLPYNMRIKVCRAESISTKLPTGAGA